MLLFQNCSSGEGLYNGGSLTDPFITDPPRVFASKISGCPTITYNFKVNDPIFICVEQAGSMPQYCLSNDQQYCYHQETISTQTGWSLLPGEKWQKQHSSNVIGNFTAYATHTDDPSAVGQLMFTISAQ